MADADNPHGLPWQSIFAGIEGVLPMRNILNCYGGTIARSCFPADAVEFGIRAANSHHALIAALEAALPHIPSGVVCNQAAAALAKAKEPAP